MKRAAPLFTATSRSVLVFAFMLIAGLVAIGIWAFRASLPPRPPVLTGTYRADDGGIYYVQRSSNNPLVGGNESREREGAISAGTIYKANARREFKLI